MSAQPAVTNRCLLADGTLLTGGWELYDEAGPCRDEFPVLGDPRVAAGGPTTGDVVACTLGPLEEIDADLDLTDDQLDRLAAVFPTGCATGPSPAAASNPRPPPGPTCPSLIRPVRRPAGP